MTPTCGATRDRRRRDLWRAAAGFVILLAAAAAPARADADGSTGPAILSAVVAANGEFHPVHSSGVIASRHLDVGRYRVTFVRSVVGCTPLAATMTGGGAVVAFGPVVADTGALDIITHDKAAAKADDVFSMIVFCPN